MRQAILQWYARNKWYLALGLVAWVVLGIAGFVHANLANLPVLPAIVTWYEWAVALMIFPKLVLWLFGIMNLGADVIRAGGAEGPLHRRRKPWVEKVERSLVMMALVVYVLDLGTRGLFGLGWDPFFV